MISNLEIDAWLGHSDARRAQIAEDIAKRISDQLTFHKLIRCGKDVWPVATFRHASLVTPFCLIPGGVFRMGLGSKEIDTAKLIGAERESEYLEEFFDTSPLLEPVIVPPFIMSSHPITVGEVSRSIAYHDIESDDTFAFLDFDEAEECAKAHKLSLPSECQWEYACRGGRKTLFWWGNKLPPEPELQRLLELSVVGDDVGGPLGNNFGLVSLVCGEWVADNWCDLRDRPATHKPFLDDSNIHVVKTFAGAKWPWQTAEAWMQCATAVRIGFCLEDICASQAHFRLIRDLCDIY